MVVPDKPAMGGVLVAELALVLDILVAPVELADVPSNFVPSAPNKHGAESHNVAPSPPQVATPDCYTATGYLPDSFRNEKTSSTIASLSTDFAGS